MRYISLSLPSVSASVLLSMLGEQTIQKRYLGDLYRLFCLSYKIVSHWQQRLCLISMSADVWYLASNSLLN